METPTLKKMSAKLTNMSDFCLCLFWKKGSIRPMKLELNLKNLQGGGSMEVLKRHLWSHLSSHFRVD